MKKTAVVLALAFGFSFTNINATNDTFTSHTDEITTPYEEVSALCKAVVTGNVEQVKNLLEAGADVNKKSRGMLPIHYAAKYNRVDMIKILITAGSEIHTPCDKGLTALRHAEKTNAKDAALFLKRFKKRNV